MKKLDANYNAIDTGNDQSMFALKILEKIKQKVSKFSKGSVTVLQKLANYHKLKSAGKNKTGQILRINKKKFEDEEFAHELFLTTRQVTKIWSGFANNTSTDIKLSKAQMSKIT